MSVFATPVPIGHGPMKRVTPSAPVPPDGAAVRGRSAHVDRPAGRHAPSRPSPPVRSRAAKGTTGGIPGSPRRAWTAVPALAAAADRTPPPSS